MTIFLHILSFVARFLCFALVFIAGVGMGIKRPHSDVILILLGAVSLMAVSLILKP